MMFSSHDLFIDTVAPLLSQGALTMSCIQTRDPCINSTAQLDKLRLKDGRVRNMSTGRNQTQDLSPGLPGLCA